MMSEIKLKSILFLAFLVAWNAGPGWPAQEPELRVAVDKSVTRVNEEVHLNIKITGVRGALQAPRLPPLEAFEVFYSGRASHFSFINGRSESMTEFNYVLVPKSAGTFVLRPIEIAIDDKIYKTDQLEIRVEGGGVLSQPAPVPPGTAQTFPPFSQGSGTGPPPASYTAPLAAAPASLSGADENIFLRVTPSKLSVYTDEQLALTYSLLTRYDTRYEGFDEEPDTSGFWIEEFPMDRDIGRDTEMVNGRKYVRADIKKVALFPTAPGQYQIKPGTIKASVQIQERSSSMLDDFFNDSFFSGAGLFSRRMEKRLSAPPIQIQVKPLPENGKPSSFQGAVGHFRMATSVDKRVVKQNEAVTLSIVIEGEGNIETLAPPKIPEIQGVKIYPSDTKTESLKQGGLIAGRKHVEIVMIPTESGELVIPGLEFSFFNPRTEQYVLLKSDPFHIKVEASREPSPVLPKDMAEGQGEPHKKEIRQESEDIQYIKEFIRPRTRLPAAVRWLLLMDGVLSLGVIGAAIARRRNEFFERNTSVKRARFAKKLAMAGAKRLGRLARDSSRDPAKAEVFFEETDKVLSQYLADKLDLSPYGVTREAIEEELAKTGVEGGTIQKIRDCFALCDEVRFGRAQTHRITEKEMVSRLKEIVGQLG